MQPNTVIHIDKYTKVILTIIAFTLLGIMIKLYFSPSEAIAKSPVMDVNIRYIDGRSPSSGLISINLEQIDGRSIGNHIPIDLKSIDGQSISGRVIPVDISRINGQTIYNEIPVILKK
jgi:hypothetical protein